MWEVDQKYHKLKNTGSSRIIGYCETIVIQLTVVTIKDLEGKYKKLNHCKTITLAVLIGEDSVFLSNQRPDKNNMRHRKLF